MGDKTGWVIESTGLTHLFGARQIRVINPPIHFDPSHITRQENEGRGRVGWSIKLLFFFFFYIFFLFFLIFFLFLNFFGGFTRQIAIYILSCWCFVFLNFLLMLGANPLVAGQGGLGYLTHLLNSIRLPRPYFRRKELTHFAIQNFSFHVFILIFNLFWMKNLLYVSGVVIPIEF